MIKVWDIALRAFHWALAIGFAAAYLTGDEDSDLHQWIGYTIAGLIAFRLVWGLIGPRYARFSQFLRGPGAVIGYLSGSLTGASPRYIGHNPAGAAMIVAMLLTLSGTGFTGWLMADPVRIGLLPEMPAFVAPAFADDDGDGGDGGDGALKEVHEVLANLMLLLVGLHLAGVVASSLAHRENLARSMVTGRKRAAGPGDIA
ncbi:cytochrome b/b6 domain-containing protein [Rhodobacter ferrooxidans]|uniref:Cytochrome B561 n=1 Tax=Rhodobacter ferrooxidans TaxID=371731 RepID=C8RZP9_9RHOB|nr:cytochrome b/b6 domain-containing protein [Rhodobacter sp. SW2]EEW25846.1 cytochrome B561 [Rhodobacter sp. SW2]